MSSPYRVKGIQIAGSPKAESTTLSEKQPIYTEIAKQAQELVQQLIKDGKLPPTTIKDLYAGTLQMQIQGDRFTICDAKGNTVTSGKAAIQAAQEISSLAKTYLSTAPIAPSSPAPQAATLHNNDPHPMENGSLYCYANSAYQLLGNIPSLRKSVLANLPNSLKDLRDYSQMQKGSALIAAWNKTADQKERFDVKKGQMASEFLERLVGKCSNYPFANLTTMHTRKDPQHNPKRSSSSEPQGFLGLNTDQEGDSIDFGKALATALHTQADPNTVGDEEAIDSRSYFEKSPTQLFIKVARFKDDGTKEKRAIKNIPTLLDTTSIVKEGTSPTQLELKGFIVHTGNGLGHVGGHYTAYVKVEDSKNPGNYHWIHTDDAQTPCVIDNQEELQRALENASDLYYDNELLELPHTLTTAIEYTKNKQAFLATEAQNEGPTYEEFLHWAFNTLLLKEEQDTIACAVAQEHQGFVAKLLEIPLSYGRNYIQQHPEDALFKRLLQEALSRRKDHLLPS